MKQGSVYNLAKAVCQQWLDDGKPKNGRTQVELYAKLLQQMSSSIHKKHTLQHAQFISREGVRIL